VRQLSNAGFGTGSAAEIGEFGEVRPEFIVL
jgi:hypothetical protein